MVTPYYQADGVTLYHGDALAITDWTAGDVLVVDPPYGRGWKQSGSAHRGYHGGYGNAGIVNDTDTSVRDAVIALWGTSRPGAVFSSPLAENPAGTRQVLAWQKPDNAGVFGSFGGWRRDWEAIYLIGPWKPLPACRSGVIRTPGGLDNYLKIGHPHAKPVALLELLIGTCPPGVIADPCAGSGTALIAAKRLGREAIGVEIHEPYCEIIARRLDQGALGFGEAS